MTTATGLGPLPELLEARESRKAVRRVFAEEGVPLALVGDRRRQIPLKTLASLFRRAAEQAGDPRLGLDVGVEMPPGDYGLWARYAMQAPTLGEALSRAARTLHLHQTGTAMRIAPRLDGRVAWEYRHADVSSAAFREHTNHVIPVMLRFVRAYLGSRWIPLGIEVGYASPRHAAMLEIATETEWRFAEPCLAIILPVSALRSERARAGGPQGHAPLLSYADVVAETTPEAEYGPVADIVSVIALRLLQGDVDIDGAASLLGLGRRRVQRRLEEQGTTYRSLVTQLRMRRAKSLIEGGQVSLKRVALDLGYSDPAHFTRAFGRFHGYPPSHLRPRLRER